MSNKKVLATWMVYKGKNKFQCHCFGRSVYGEIDKDWRGKIDIIDFGKDGYWPLADFVFFPPENLGELNSWLSDSEEEFAKKNGLYVFFVKVAKPLKKYRDVSFVEV